MCKTKKCNYIKVNFANDFANKKKEIILKEFDAKLFDEYTNVIYNLYQDDDLLELLLNEITNNDKNEYSSLKRLGRHIKSIKDWTDYDNDEKIDIIIEWVENRFGKESSLGYKRGILEKIINFAGKAYPERLNGCFLLVFDNVDRFEDDVQNEVIDRLFGITKNLNIKVLINVRLTTFGKIAGNSTYFFDVFENGGHLPVEMLIKRLKHYLENKETNPEYLTALKLIDLDKRICFNKHVSNVLKYLTENNSRLYTTLDSLSGLSIRRSLLLARRLFINIVINHNEKKSEQDLYIKTLFIEPDNNGFMSLSDRRVTNIFTSYYSKHNSLINFRILQIIYVYKTNNENIRLKELINHLGLFENDNFDEILCAINELIKFHKRLIFVHGTSKYDNIQQLKDDAEKNVHVDITWAGQKYFLNLCENLQYIQDCFSIIDWKT